MILRLLPLGFALAVASATPLTLTFSGVGTGTLGGTAFTDSNFSLVFTSDTTLITTVSTDFTTPSGTPGSFTISTSGSPLTGTFSQDQAVFVHPSPENDVGIWHEGLFSDPDFIALKDASFASYALNTSLGPISTSDSSLFAFGGSQPCSGAPAGTDCGFTTSGGHLVFTSLSSLSFQAVVSEGSTVPEPPTGMFFAIGLVAVAAGSFARKR